MLHLAHFFTVPTYLLHLLVELLLGLLPLYQHGVRVADLGLQLSTADLRVAQLILHLLHALNQAVVLLLGLIQTLAACGQFDC